MSELGAMADFLESSGEPGLAAAVRVLEYCEAEGIGLCGEPDPDEVSLGPLIARIEGRLEALGRPEMSDRLHDIHRDILDYGHILPDRSPDSRLFYAPANGGMRAFRPGDDPRDLYIREAP